MERKEGCRFSGVQSRAVAVSRDAVRRIGTMVESRRCRVRDRPEEPNRDKRLGANLYAKEAAYGEGLRSDGRGSVERVQRRRRCSRSGWGACLCLGTSVDALIEQSAVVG